MSEAAQTDREKFIVDMAAEFQTKRVSLTIAAKRTIKVNDEYQSFESTESITLEHPAGLVPVEVARHAALLHTPMLVRKVFTDLVLGGVLLTGEAKMLIDRTEASYKRLIERKSHGTSEG